MCIFLAAGVAGAGIATSLSATGAMLANVAVAALPAVISGAVSIAGQVQAANAAKDQGKYEAKIARYEASLAEDAGKVEAFKFGVQAQREFGRLMVAQATSGKDLSYGNVLRQLTEARKFQTFDGDIIRRNADARVTSLQLSAANAISRGNNQAAQYRLGAVGSGVGILGGITSAYTSVGYAMGGFGSASAKNSAVFSTDWDPSVSFNAPSVTVPYRWPGD